MGIINHNAVIATTWNDDALRRIKQEAAQELPDAQILYGEPAVNGYATVVLVPDGSKEGWDESAEGDMARAHFIELLRRDDYADGSSPWEWIEVGFGEYGQKVLRGNCRNRYDDREYATDSE